MTTCPECAATHPEGRVCYDDFLQMLAWETENMAVNGVVHHLMVLSYNLQHPSIYSPEYLPGAISLLDDFVAKGITPQQVRARDRSKLSSTNRKYKITGTPDHHASYPTQPHWTMLAKDVVAAGEPAYVPTVTAWAHSVYHALKDSGYLDL